MKRIVINTRNLWVMFLYGLWEVLLGFLLASFIPLVSGTVVLRLLIMWFPDIMYVVPLVGFHSWQTSVLLLTWIAGAFWLPILLLILTVRGVMKFKKQGIHTYPLMWGIGMIPPLSYVVYPLYRIMSRIVWPRRLTAMSF